MRICLIQTGGTISSEVLDKSINVSKNVDIIRLYQHTYNQKHDFTLESPFFELSENLNTSHLLLLADCISNQLSKNFDGIIISHGSDTLAYTANFLAMRFCDTPVPIVLTAADKPLSFKSSNGLNNFACSVNFIQTGYRGVFVSYSNSLDIGTIHLGSRIMQSRQLDGVFVSAYDIPLATIKQNNIFFTQHPTNVQGEHLNKPRNAKCEIQTLTDQIIYISPFTSINYSMYDFTAFKPKAVIHGLYHSGTACIKGINNNVLDFVDMCDSLSIPVIFGTHPNLSEKVYESVSMLAKNTNAYIAQGTTIENLIMKCMIIFSTNFSLKQKIDFLESDLFFEHMNFT